jgi:hypothetical protein
MREATLIPAVMVRIVQFFLDHYTLVLSSLYGYVTLIGILYSFSTEALESTSSTMPKSVIFSLLP